MQDAAGVSADLEKLKAGFCQKDLLIRRSGEYVLEHGQTEIEAFLFLDARPVTLVEPHQHLVNIEVDLQGGFIPIT